MQKRNTSSGFNTTRGKYIDRTLVGNSNPESYARDSKEKATFSPLISPASKKEKKRKKNVNDFGKRRTGNNVHTLNWITVEP